MKTYKQIKGDLWINYGSPFRDYLMGETIIVDHSLLADTFDRFEMQAQLYSGLEKSLTFILEDFDEDV